MKKIQFFYWPDFWQNFQNSLHIFYNFVENDFKLKSL